ncbi:glycerate kinase [Toxorhynchites rutilus septentrionalis]|uniref:glycerate kinase n=1 Tax=Toxorhynchites rutilus septentrionalis TaxID=329112 RepID=UPI002478380B|nr:glycerate kinase [Toxorhynchites rutilus septentrionalis]
MLSLLKRYSNFKSVGYRLQHVTSRDMDHSIDQLTSLFLSTMDTVKPKALFHNYLKSSENIFKQLEIPDKTYHVIGFGKAVLGMAVQMERILGEKLQSGCISIPVGTYQRFKDDEDFQLSISSRIKIYECARNNLPDEDAVEAARAIKSLAESTTSSDVLCVLISGGGSALLPLPKDPITLGEKLSVIKSLSASGATINELNIVRILLSAVKGGKLAYAARNCYKLLSFIISDVIDDPLPLIASGPTVKNNINNDDAWNVINKYGIAWNIPSSIAKVLDTSESVHIPDNFSEIHLIGSNKIAIQHIVQSAERIDAIVIALSERVQGNVEDLSKAYAELALVIIRFRNGELSKSNLIERLNRIGKILYFTRETSSELFEQLSSGNGKDVLLVAGGETTVVIRGNGKGGRNQELALRFSYECSRISDLHNNAVLLSAGTDGIDGPTNAAGAIGCSAVIDDFLSTGNVKSPRDFIEDNDSYTFYQQVNKGNYHITIGHTGTNVMDIHLLYIPWMQKDSHGTLS